MNFIFKDNRIFIVDSSLKDIFRGDNFEFKKYFIEVYLIYYIYIFFSIMFYYRILNLVLCAI